MGNVRMRRRTASASPRGGAPFWSEPAAAAKDEYRAHDSFTLAGSSTDHGVGWGSGGAAVTRLVGSAWQDSLLTAPAGVGRCGAALARARRHPVRLGALRSDDRGVRRGAPGSPADHRPRGRAWPGHRAA